MDTLSKKKDLIEILYKIIQSGDGDKSDFCKSFYIDNVL